MNIHTIGDFRFAMEDAINLLADFSKDKPLPSVEVLEDVAARMKGISTYDVVQSILEDNDFIHHKEIYLKAFGGVLHCEIFVGVISENGNTLDYWRGMTKKLEEENTTDPDHYIEKVEEIRGYVETLLIAIKRDLRNIGILRTQGRKNSHPTNRRPEREVNETDFPAETMKGVDSNFKISEDLFSAVQRCLYRDATIKHLRMALLTCTPEPIANGNRLEILAFIFRKFAKGYTDDETSREDYLRRCMEQFKKIKTDFNFLTAAPDKETQSKIFDEVKNKFRKGGLSK